MTEDNTVPTISYGGSSGGSYGGTGGTGDGGYGGTGGTGGSGIRPLYAATVHHARQSGNLEEMKALAELAEWFLAAEGDIAAELAALKEEIAKLEAASGG